MPGRGPWRRRCDDQLLVGNGRPAVQILTVLHSPISSVMRSRRLYQLLLGAIAILLLLLLWSCSAGEGGRGNGTSRVRPMQDHRPTRLILGRSEAGDSAKPVTEFHVDQSLRAVIDSIDGVDYVTINVRDSLAESAIAAGGKGLPTNELERRLGVDGVAFFRIERFGSVLVAQMRVAAPADNRLLFSSVAWSFIRYRDTAGTMYLGPTLFDLIRQLLGRCYRVPHRSDRPVATEPLVMTTIVIPRDPALDQVSVHREEIATSGVKALGEYARRHFPELIAFDYAGRAALYRTVNIGGVEDYVPTGASERRAMFNLGIERYVTGLVRNVGPDSLLLRIEIRGVNSPSSDTLVDAEERRYPISRFQTSTVVDDVVIPLIDLAEPLFKREAERVAASYGAGTGGD